MRHDGDSSGTGEPKGAGRHSEPTALRRPSIRFFVLAVSAFGALLIAEAGLRLGAHLTHRGRAATFDAELGWKFLPNITKASKLWCARAPGRTNSRGWRDAESAFDKPPGIRRILTLGDSFTFGQNVDFGERFTEVLEQRIERLEVVNLGVYGYGTDQELRLFETEGRRYDPDVVLLAVFPNDLDDIRCRVLHSWPKPYYLLEDGNLRLVKPRQTWDVALRTSSYLAELCFKAMEGGTLRAVRAAPWREAAPCHYSMP